MTNNKIIIANWKMHKTFQETDDWMENFLPFYLNDINKYYKVIICPPFYLLDYIDSGLNEISLNNFNTYIERNNIDFYSLESDFILKKIYSGRIVSIGSQNCFYKDFGSNTGEVSPAMLKEVGCEYCIIGHSETRAENKETSDKISKKIEKLIYHDITPILCVGETIEIRNNDKYLNFLYKQLIETIPNNINIEHIIIAYEPIWSIGTGNIPAMEQILEVINLFKKILSNKFSNIKKYSLLYGGSCNSSNSKDILAIDGVDGLLVGSSSLKSDEFIKICEVNQ